MIYQANTLQVKELQDGIAELRFCSKESVNKLDLATLESLNHALDALKAHQGLKGLILTSDKESFIVGADITEFLGLLLPLRKNSTNGCNLPIAFSTN